MIDATNDPAEIKSRTAAALAADPSINGILATGPHPCMPAVQAVQEAGMEGKVNIGCFDLIPDIITALKDGQVAYAVDQQQYLQGYLPVIALDLYTKYGLLPPTTSCPARASSPRRTPSRSRSSPERSADPTQGLTEEATFAWSPLRVVGAVA